ncbi:ribonuclease HI, partial [bacterium]|nr:ribonuclease HI [bacterium]
KPVPNANLWKRLIKAAQGHDIKLEWIKGHAGYGFNERCDRLAVAAYKKDNLKTEL